MNPTQRRNFLKHLAIGASTGLIGTTAFAKQLTPSEIEGPFYPTASQADKDKDMTKVIGKTGVAKGQLIDVFGHIVDQHMQAIEGATIDIWQANTYGRYRHPSDKNTAPLDENFQGWATLKSDQNGAYHVKTIMPGIYPISPNRVRTPHIHFKVRKQGYSQLTTQMYFPHHPLNATDTLIGYKSEEQVALMTAARVTAKNSDVDQYQFKIVLNRI